MVGGRLENEGNVWSNSGAHPWHLDDQTESILFLTNTSAQMVRFGFRVDALGKSYFLTKLRLNPHETRTIDLRKLRDAQQKDFKGNLIPATASDGSVTWIRLQNVPVLGRLVVLRRHQGIASSYQCGACPCPSYAGLCMTPSPSFALGANTCYQYTATGTYTTCSGQTYSDLTDLATWTSDDSAVATVSAGMVTGVASGTAHIKASYTADTFELSDGNNICEPTGQANYNCTCTTTVVQITGPQTVWWFNGQTPSAYQTTITLTALPAGQSSYDWSLLAGTDKGVLSGQNGNTINLSGNDYSTTEGDITVQVEVFTSTGEAFASQTYTVRGPYMLVPGSKFHTALAGFGYESQIWYTIYDNFNATMPSNVPFTEEWTTSPVAEYGGSGCSGGTNWTLAQFIPTPHGGTSSNSQFYDLITGPGINNTPAPCPTPTGPGEQLGSSLVVEWGQRWRVGTTTSGLGAAVQSDTFERFVDHGEHSAITSPD